MTCDLFKKHQELEMHVGEMWHARRKKRIYHDALHTMHNVYTYIVCIEILTTATLRAIRRNQA
jgi:hypothetical protein